MTRLPFCHSQVQSAPPPVESLLAAWYPRANLVDTFILKLLPGETRDINRLAEAVLAHPAFWFRALLAVRDKGASTFGIKTTEDLRATIEAEGREKIDFFRVLKRTENEMIFGEDDKHLDFRLSLLRRVGSEGDELVATSVVQCHNLLGRVYLAAIKPFHVLVVRDKLLRSRKWL